MKTGRLTMKCLRCQGLLVRDHFYDTDGPFLHIEMLRCLNCGETVYPKMQEQQNQTPDYDGRKRNSHAA